MSAAENIRLEGKDWFREPEAAEYCGLSLGEFRQWCQSAQLIARRVGAGKRGRKLYSRADLYSAIDSSPTWQKSTPVEDPGISRGQRTTGTGGGLSDRLQPVRRREFVPRRKPS